MSKERDWRVGDRKCGLSTEVLRVSGLAYSDGILLETGSGLITAMKYERTVIKWLLGGEIRNLFLSYAFSEKLHLFFFFLNTCGTLS